MLKNEKNKLNKIKKVLFTATVDSHILHFHIPYLKMFKEEGYEVHVATNGDEDIPYCDKKHKVSFERSPIKINNLKAIRQLKKIINYEKFDVIHCHTPMGSVVTRLAAMKARKNGTRVIYTAHGFHFFKGAGKLNWIVFYPIEKWLSKYTDTLITINGEDYDFAKKKFYSKQIELVHGVGVDFEKFSFEMSPEEKDMLRKEIGVSKEDFVMIYPAELSKRKNQGMILECIAELIKENKNIKLLLPGLDSMNGMYQQMTKDLNIEENVKFLGYRTDIPKLIKISNLAVSSARQEGLPVNIMEAMVCGVPAVVTNCRGNRDLIENDVNGYVVEIDDIKGMTEAIKKIYNNQVDWKMANLDKIELASIKNRMRKIYFRKPKVMFYTMSMSKGGAERVIANLSNDFYNNNYDITIVTNIKDKCYYELNEKIKFLCIDRNNKYTLLTKIVRKLGCYRTRMLYKYIQNEQPDIIIGMLPEPSIRLLSLKSRLSAKIIISDRNDPNTEYTNKMFRHIVFKLYKKADGFVFQTEDASKYFEGIIKCDSKIIPNPINPKFIKEPYNGEREKNIVTVGRLEKQKNQELLLDAFSEVEKEYPEYSLLIYGEGSRKEELQKIIKEKGLKNKAILKGKIDDVENAIHKATLFVLSSDYEGMPNALMEAMALGLPCISTDCPCGGPKYLIENGKSGLLVPVGNKEAMVKAIKAVLRDKENAEKMAKEASKIKDRLDPYIINNEWLTYITEIYERGKKVE